MFPKNYKIGVLKSEQTGGQKTVKEVGGKIGQTDVKFSFFQSVSGENFDERTELMPPENETHKLMEPIKSRECPPKEELEVNLPSKEKSAMKNGRQIETVYSVVVKIDELF